MAEGYAGDRDANKETRKKNEKNMKSFWKETDLLNVYQETMELCIGTISYPQKLSLEVSRIQAFRM
jgi:hypothetical protein